MNSFTWSDEELSARIEAVAKASAPINWLSGVTTSALWKWITLELGPDWAPNQTLVYGDHRLRTFPCSPIYHIVSGNTPHAAIQTLTRGILVGAMNRLKLPALGLPDLEIFINGLPERLRPETDPQYRTQWFEQAATVVVFGSDETIREFSNRVAPWQRFLPHGHKLSFSLVLGGYNEALVRKTGLDICAFDQLGCLSPQFCFVAQEPRRFCELLAPELDRAAAFGSIDFITATALRSFRDDWRFRAAQDSALGFWESRDSLRWTIILLASKDEIPPNPLFGTVIVKPWSDKVRLDMAALRRFVSTISIDPLTDSNIELGLELGAQRICPPGSMQNPPLSWHHDGWPSLQSLLRYVDIEEGS
jgi:Acyl-CoA reductase (LuxC)